MVINAVELVLLGVAFGLSNWKLTPLVLVCFNVLVQLMEWRADHMLGYYDNPAVPIEMADKALMGNYLFEALAMFLVAVVLYFIKSKISFFTSFVVLIQCSFSLLAAFGVYSLSEFSLDVDWIFNAHSLVSDWFVIVYVSIAWTCVIMSKKGKG